MGVARNKKWLVFMLMLGFGSILVFVIIILLVVDVVVMDVVVAADVVVLAVFCNGRTSEFPTAPTSCAILKCIPPRKYCCRNDERSRVVSV